MERLRHIPGTTLPEKRENLYVDIERKIGVLRDFWRAASTLGNPSPNNSNEIIEQERTIFTNVLQDKEGELLQGDDFIYNLSISASRAMRKRSQIRSALQQLDSGDSWDNVLPRVLLPLKDGIKRVVIKPFSINLVVDHSAIQEWRRSSGAKFVVEPTEGFHEPNTVFNVMDEQGLNERVADYRSFSDLERTGALRIFSQGRSISNLMASSEEEYVDIAFDHEDFHSFAEDTPLSDGINLNEVTMELVLGIKDGKAEQGLIQWSDLLDYGQEELVAELASSEYIRHFGMNQTFAGVLKAKQELLDKVISETGDSELSNDPHIQRTIQALDVIQVNNFIVEMYERIRVRVPERAEDLDMAFALFPPSKWRHIRRLVQRWEEQAA